MFGCRAASKCRNNCRLFGTCRWGGSSFCRTCSVLYFPRISGSVSLGGMTSATDQGRSSWPPLSVASSGVSNPLYGQEDVKVLGWAAIAPNGIQVLDRHRGQLPRHPLVSIDGLHAEYVEPGLVVEPSQLGRLGPLGLDDRSVRPPPPPSVAGGRVGADVRNVGFHPDDALGVHESKEACGLVERPTGVVTQSEAHFQVGLLVLQTLDTAGNERVELVVGHRH